MTVAKKSILIICYFLASVVAIEKYTDKYDNINMQEVLDNRRLLLAYANCILDKGKCSPEGRELKEHIQDALETGCKKCTEAQVNGATAVIEHLIKTERNIWRQLTDKYDPQGIWRKKYEDRARENGIVIPND